MLQNNDIAILILFFERVDQTIDCISSFLPSGCNIYILNNNSSQDSTNKLTSFIKGKKEVHYFYSESNLGAAGGRNFLINKISEDWLFLVDNDITIPTKDWVNTFSKIQKNNPDTQVFLPKMFEPHTNEYAKNKQYYLDGRVVRERYISNDEYANMFPGGASIVHKLVFQNNGLFDDKLKSGLDYEIAIRCLLNKNPIKAKPIDSIELIHDHKPLKHKEDIKAAKVRYNLQNISQTYTYIQEKHNIIFDHDWEWWTRKQIFDMTERNWFKNIILRIQRLFYK